MKFKFIYSLLLGVVICSLFISLANNSSATVVDSVRPKITVKFDEPVILYEAVIYPGEPFAYPPPEPVPLHNYTTDSVVFTFEPTWSLQNGYHELFLYVTDLVGNTLFYNESFTVDAENIDIHIIEPRIGVSNRTKFDVVIGTRRGGEPVPSYCKWAYQALPPILSPITFELSFLLSFDASNTANTAHTYYNYTKEPQKYVPNYFYVICNDTGLERIAKTRFDIYVDTGKPSIVSAAFNPQMVLEKQTDGSLITYLTVAANEEVICRYSRDNITDDYFDNYNLDDYFDNYDDYVEEYTQLINLPEQREERGEYYRSYTYYIVCEDRAGWETDIAERELIVNLSTPLSILVNSPKRYSSERQVIFNISTNKISNCWHGDESNFPFTISGGRTHVEDLGIHLPGEYNLKASCISGGKFHDSVDFNFIIDTTAPSTVNISGPDTVCKEDKIVFDPALTVKSTDDGSDIDYYFYAVTDSSSTVIAEGLIAPKSAQDSTGSLSEIVSGIDGKDINLTSLASYRLVVSAFNKAELESSTSIHTFSYNPGAQACLEKDPPRINIIKNTTFNAVDVTIECTDESGCDSNTFYIGTHTNMSSCSPIERLYGPPFGTTLFETNYLCWNISDIHGNSAASSELINVEVERPDSCTNTILDADESDVDCGGSCTPCGNGKNCTQDLDCLSEYCDPTSKCALASCDDTIQNQGETDIDCGGSNCDPCGLGQRCLDHSDCESTYCDPSNNTCAPPSCSDEVLNQDETDIDCGGLCDKCLAGKKCLENMDCESGVCEFNYCVDKEPDSDNDGLPDWWETKYGFDPNDPLDANQDPDGDGLTNIEEYNYYKTSNKEISPINADTDGDKFSDKVEIDAGTDPTDETSKPRTLFTIFLDALAKWMFLVMGLLMISGGVGYLIYKKYVKKVPQQQFAQRQTPQQAYQSRLKFLAQKKAQEDARRRQLQQQQKRKQDMKKKMISSSSKKEQERSKIFDAFSSSSKKGEAPTKNPSFIERIKNPVVKAGKTIKEREGWVPLSKMGQKGAEESVADEKKHEPKAKVEESKDMFKELAEITDVRVKKATAKNGLREKEVDIDKLMGELATGEAEEKDALDKDAFEFLEEKKKKPKPTKTAPQAAAAPAKKGEADKKTAEAKKKEEGDIFDKLSKQGKGETGDEIFDKLAGSSGSKSSSEDIFDKLGSSKKGDAIDELSKISKKGKKGGKNEK